MSALLDAVGGLHILRKSTENLRQLIRDEVATWVSEIWQNCKIQRSISILQRKCGFMLKSDIKSYPSATDPFFPG